LARWALLASLHLFSHNSLPATFSGIFSDFCPSISPTRVNIRQFKSMNQ
jgi:hypothetical protein